MGCHSTSLPVTEGCGATISVFSDRFARLAICLVYADSCVVRLR